MNQRLTFCQRNHHIKNFTSRHLRHFSWRRYKLVQLIFLSFLNYLLAEIGLIVRELKPHNVWKAVVCVLFFKIFRFPGKKSGPFEAVFRTRQSTDMFKTEAFLKIMIRSSWKAYSQIYTRGIEKEKEQALSCHYGPSSARQQTAVSEVKDSIRLFAFLRV